MTARVIESSGYCLYIADEAGPVIRTVQDFRDLLGNAGAHGAAVVVVPVERLDPGFFNLKTGLAGECIQRVVNYRWKLAVIGDISAQTAASSSVRGLVAESNRGTTVFFLPNLAALVAKLAVISEP